MTSIQKKNPPVVSQQLNPAPSKAAVDSISKAQKIEADKEQHKVISQIINQAIEPNEIDLFRKELEAKYDLQVVDALFKKLKKTQKKSLTDGDKERFEIWCHYFEIESFFRKQIHNTQSSKARLLNHYLKYTQREVYYRISRSVPETLITHEHILKCAENIQKFIGYQDSLIETFDEILCHRSLTKVSLLPSEVLLGLSPIEELEPLKERIYNYYKDEIFLREQIESSGREELREHAEELKTQITALKSYVVAKELFTKLAIKSGRVDWLKAPFPKNVIQAQAELFEACRLADEWVEEQDELIPIPGAGGVATSQGQINLNMVYFLKELNQDACSPPVAVFKNAVSAASIEALVYDAAIIFGLQNAFVPTKLKSFKGKAGSVQVYQKGLSWSDFLDLAPKKTKEIAPLKEKTQKAENAALSIEKSSPDTKISDTESSQLKLSELKTQNKSISYEKSVTESSLEKMSKSERVNLQNEIVKSISMEDFLKVGLATILFGNRDLHVGNFFLVQKEDGNYTIVSFDNEMCFFQSNYVILDSHGNCHLPIRNSLLIFPQADVPLTGDFKEHLRKFINSFEKKFQEFVAYTTSSAGKYTLKGLPRGKLSSYQMKAFKSRIDKLIKLINSSKDFTYRDLVYRTFPLYESFLSLTKFLYPDQPEMMVGFHSAQELCDEVIKLGYMTPEKKKEFIKEIKRYEFK